MIPSQMQTACVSRSLVAKSAARFRAQSHSSSGHGDQQWNGQTPNWGKFAGALAAGAGAAVYINYGGGMMLEASLSDEDKRIVNDLKSVCSEVITGTGKTKSYVSGMRIGKGSAIAVCKPKTLREAVDALQKCVDNDCAIITQGANTGLTGGSVPRDNIDRKCVVINMRHITQITSVGSGDNAKMVCAPGAGILDLSNACLKMGRESHSVLGSVFLNPSVAAGVAFGSGGTQVRKGPAYTERTIYAKVQADGKVVIVDETGIKADSVDEVLRKIETGDISESDLDLSGKKRFWCDNYPDYVARLKPEPARYNSYAGSVSEASRCEGKVMILGTVHQTFPQAEKKEVYWVSADKFEDISALRTNVALGDASGKTLPNSCEYMNKDTIDITISHGASSCAAILLGGMNNLGRMYKLQALFDRILPLGTTDLFLALAGSVVPKSFILPKQVIPNLGMNHHAVIDMGDFGGGELDALKERFAKFQKDHPGAKAVKLPPHDIAKANIFRFTNAAAFKVFCLLKKYPGLSLDYALRKDDSRGFPDAVAPVHRRMIYGHFACNVIHDDIAFEKGVDPHQVKYEIKDLIEDTGGTLPAEHGHGTEYSGTPAFQKKLVKSDPLNIMNPGVAGTSSKRNYA